MTAQPRGVKMRRAKLRDLRVGDDVVWLRIENTVALVRIIDIRRTDNNGTYLATYDYEAKLESLDHVEKNDVYVVVEPGDALS